MMITAKDLSDRWGISLPTIYKLFHAGRLPGQRLSQKNIRFKLSDIIAYEEASSNTNSRTIVGASESFTDATDDDDPTVDRLIQQMELLLNEEAPETPLSFGGIPVIER